MSLSGGLLRAASIFFPSVLVLALLDQWPYLTETFSRGQVLGRDAYIFWLAGNLALEGRVAEIYDHAAFAEIVRSLLGPEAGLHVFPYPPPALIYLAVFGGVSYFLTLALWSLLGVAAFLWAVAFRQWERRDLLLALLAPVTLTNVVLGQNGLLTAALFVGGLRLAAHRPIIAGALIGAMAYKPLLAVFLPLILMMHRRWICVASAGATLLALCLLPVLFWGWEVWRFYLDQAAPFQLRLLESGTGVGQAMKPSAFMGMRIIGASVATSYLVQLAFSTAATVLIAIYLWQHRRREIDAGRTVLAVAVATILVIPYVHHYDLAVISAGLILLVRDEGGAIASLREVLLFGLLWGLPILCLIFNLLGVPVSPVILLLALLLLVSKPPLTSAPAANTTTV